MLIRPRDKSSLTGISKRYRTTLNLPQYIHLSSPLSVSDKAPLRQNSLTPILVPSNDAGGATVVAPGAEQVGQAQILNTFSKPFTLEGLFGAADAGAFGGTSGDVPMTADEDGDIFWDAVEGEAMEEDG